MAIAEQEITRQLNIPVTEDQRERLERAARATGQSIEGFAASALLRAADAALTPLPPADNPLDKVIGIFKDEPLMDELMERIRRDRQAEIEAYAMEAQAEE